MYASRPFLPRCMGVGRVSDLCHLAALPALVHQLPSVFFHSRVTPITLRLARALSACIHPLFHDWHSQRAPTGCALFLSFIRIPSSSLFFTPSCRRAPQSLQAATFPTPCVPPYPCAPLFPSLLPIPLVSLLTPSLLLSPRPAVPPPSGFSPISLLSAICRPPESKFGSELWFEPEPNWTRTHFSGLGLAVCPKLVQRSHSSLLNHR
ncbi:hypothetical protein EDB85DRAFT_1097943 [Lactarius pseudohatsudake]|nr:hypothetical protein EDB85DRAFT_1097943 [Lactarius pseudohatsudake]